MTLYCRYLKLYMPTDQYHPTKLIPTTEWMLEKDFYNSEYAQILKSDKLFYLKEKWEFLQNLNLTSPPSSVII